MIELKTMMAADCARYIEPMLEAHYQEVGNTKLYKLKPDYRKYAAVEQQGGLLAIVALEDGVAVGYSVNFLTAHPHYVDSKVCYNDVLFVTSAKRTLLSSVGARLIIATRSLAKEAGAQVVQWHAKPNTALDQMLSKRVPLFERCYVEQL